MQPSSYHAKLHLPPNAPLVFLAFGQVISCDDTTGITVGFGDDTSITTAGNTLLWSAVATHKQKVE